MIYSDMERQAPTSVSETEPSHLARYNFALGYIKNTDSVLDIPCGAGYGSNVMAETAKNVMGIDINTGAIQHAKEFFQKDNIDFIVADMQKIETNIFNDKKFNIIVSFEGIEHVNQQQKFINNIAKILRRDGYLIISTPQKPHGSPYHTIEFSLEQFIEILSNDFIIEKIYGQKYTDIFDITNSKEDFTKHSRFNYIAVCKPK